METATLDDYVALNEQLAALVAAGVPLDVDWGTSAGGAPEALERINATVVRRVGRGESLAQALEDDDRDLPPSYRALVQLGLRSGDLGAALDDSSRVAATADGTRQTLASALVYPLIVCALVYAGLIGSCIYFVPTLANMYESLQMPPGPALRVLEAVSAALPYWATILPITFVVALAWQLYAAARRRATGEATVGLAAWLPGATKILFQERCGRFADSLAELLRDQAPLAAALRTAGDACGDAALRDGARLLATATSAPGQLPDDNCPAALEFPPFLRWALWHSEPTTGRVRALEVAARLYWETAARRAERLRSIAPVVAIVFVGGTATLLYGLALFVPLVELLYTLAK